MGKKASTVDFLSANQRSKPLKLGRVAPRQASRTLVPLGMNVGNRTLRVAAEIPGWISRVALQLKAARFMVFLVELLY